MIGRSLRVSFGLLAIIVCLSKVPPAWSQPAQNAPSSSISPAIDSLRQQAQIALDSLDIAEVEILAPKSYRHARNAFDEALRLIESDREPDLTHVKLKVALEAAADAAQSAAEAHIVFSDELAERDRARDAGADTLATETWRRAESSLRDALAQFERDPQSSVSGDDISGVYRAARREALRAQILGEARLRIHQAELRGGDKTVPTLLLRANQAVSRAEADLAQENLETARLDANEALNWADHALALMTYIEQAQKQQRPWESALLPYDDLLADIADYLGGRLDFSQGGPASGSQLFDLIDTLTDSLSEQLASRDSALVALEDSLAAIQDSIAQLMAADSAQADSAVAALSPEELAQHIERAQAVFKRGEAEVFANSGSSVTIRLKGLQFTSGATKLNKIHLRILDRAVVAIAQFPDAAIRVEGHTDASGGSDINQMLSESRAKNVAAYLVKKLRLNNDQIESEGLGEELPIASNRTADGRARNRRIDVILTLK